MKQRNFLPLQLFAACLVGLLLGKFCFGTSKEKVELSLFNGRLSKMQSVINIIDNKYVDPLDIDSLNELIIPDVLAHLDPHTSYIPAQKLADVEKKILGHFYGIGIEHYTFDDTAMVISVMPDSPASKSDIKPGDRILKVDDTDVTGHKAKDKVSAALKGERDTPTVLTLKRYGVDSTVTVHVQRGNVPVPSTTASYMIDSITGYIKIDNFGDNSYREFVERVIRLRDDGATNLVIDLRNNLGGRVEQAKLIASEILGCGDTIVFTIGRDNTIEDLYIDTTQYGFCQDMSIACLVDSRTASAAEILAAAIQDNDRGVIVGLRTFGKGLVQTPIQMPDGSQVRLTTYRYYTPSGRSLQKGYSNYDNDLPNRFKNGELDSASAFKPVDTTKYFTKSGRVVYSKSGVMPDVFVPLDHTLLPNVAYRLDSMLITMRFAAFKYNQLGFDNPQQYIHMLFANEEQTYDELLAFARSKGLDIDLRKQKKAIADAMPMVMAALRADAYHIVGDEDMSAKYYNFEDDAVSAAVEVLGDSHGMQDILNNKKTKPNE